MRQIWRIEEGKISGSSQPLKAAKMRQNSGPVRERTGRTVVKDIRRATRRHSSAEEKIRIVLEYLRGEEFIAAITQHISDKHFQMVPYYADGVPVRVIEA